MINYSFCGSARPMLANLGELCALEDLSYVGIPLELITFLLTRSQVTAHETKARLVQGHAY